MEKSIMTLSNNTSSTLEYYFFHALPRPIIQDIIFREILSLGDIARLEVAAAVHRIHEQDKVRHAKSAKI
jgi:hypothetical protein